jgi:putative transposase
MGQSLVKNHIHIVFSTKHRAPLIKKEIRARLFAYLAEICNQNNSHAIIVGGHLDHVHILCNLSKSITLAHLIKEIKIHSSKWIKSIGDEYRNFYWQDGYGAFGVQESSLGFVKNYIQNQESHHSKINFKHEYKSILDEFGVDFDERYVWE